MTFSNRPLVSTAGRLSLLTLALLASPFALADDAGWYAGASLGQSGATIDDDRISRGLLSRGLSTTAISDDDRSRGYKLFGGYQFNRNFALEGGYFDLGQFGFLANTNPAGSLSGNIKLRGINLDAVGTLPITEKFSVFGRIGAARTQARDTFVGTGAVTVIDPSPGSRDTHLKVGLGMQYALTNALSLRAELERYRIDDAVGNKGDVDLVSLGLVYRFGAKTPIPVPREAAPLALAHEPVPAPVITVAPPPPPPPSVPQKVSLSADSLFDFDNAAVKPTGRLALDQLAADLKGVDFDVIHVTGHTDRIGSPAYNQKLSTRRAQAVNGYLVESAGLAASKIQAQGVAGSDPVTRPGECVGTRVTPALIKCLQPDRRVDIEVTGQR